MPDQWDRFASGADQSVDALGYHDNIDVFQPTESFTQGEGWDVSYPSTADATLSGIAEPPDADRDRDRGGTTRDADLVLHVPADTNVTFDESGESGDAPTRVEVADSDRTYEVATAPDPQFDGLQTVACVEV
jgi:hypothetical protein